MIEQHRLRVRPVYHGSDLLVEVMGDHRRNDFPDVAHIVSEALHAQRVPHPEELDVSELAFLEDRFISYWTCQRGSYELDDDMWGLFFSANGNNQHLIASIEAALVRSGRFVKECVDFKQFE